MIFTCSTTEPGQPWQTTSGSASSCFERTWTRLLMWTEAVAQTPGEAAGSLLSVGSEIGHLSRHERGVRRKVVGHNGCDGHFRERAAHFLRPLLCDSLDEQR
jgi:hypothetical protein